jgi:hypothetical protein
VVDCEGSRTSKHKLSQPALAEEWEFVCVYLVDGVVAVYVGFTLWSSHDPDALALLSVDFLVETL